MDFYKVSQKLSYKKNEGVFHAVKMPGETFAVVDSWEKVEELIKALVKNVEKEYKEGDIKVKATHSVTPYIPKVFEENKITFSYQKEDLKDTLHLILKIQRITVDFAGVGAISNEILMAALFQN